MTGTWEQQGEIWKFKKADGSYAAKEWGLINGKWFYFGADGTMAVGWQMIDGIWYYFRSSGDMKTGWGQAGRYLVLSGGKRKDENWLALLSRSLVLPGLKWKDACQHQRTGRIRCRQQRNLQQTVIVIDEGCAISFYRRQVIQRLYNLPFGIQE